MYELKLDSSFLQNLSSEGRKWMAYAMIGMVLTDNDLDPNEIQLLQDAVSLLDHEDEKAELLAKAQRRERIEVPFLTSDRAYLADIFFYLAMIAVVDGSIRRSEYAHFKYLCEKLGFDQETSQLVMNWGDQALKLMKERDRISDAIRVATPLYENK
jgi:uncharacterized tellurite resistance protein B-like protein